MTDKEILNELNAEIRERNARYSEYLAGMDKRNKKFEETTAFLQNVVDLIKSQRAEIEKLKNDIFSIINEKDAWADIVDTTAAEAIKKFVERMENECIRQDVPSPFGILFIDETALNNLVKETTEQ